MLPVRQPSQSVLHRTVRLGIVPLALMATVLVPVVARADSNCGPSNGQTLCVTVPGSPLSGDTNVTVTNSPNTGVGSRPGCPAPRRSSSSRRPSPATNDIRSFGRRRSISMLPTVLRRVDRRDTGRSGGHARQNTTDFNTPRTTGRVSPAHDDRTIPLSSRSGTARRTGPSTVAADRFSGSAASLPRRRTRRAAHRVPEPLRAPRWMPQIEHAQRHGRHHAADHRQPRNASTAPFIDYWHQRPLTKFTFGGVCSHDRHEQVS